MALLSQNVGLLRITLWTPLMENYTCARLDLDRVRSQNALQEMEGN